MHFTAVSLSIFFTDLLRKGRLKTCYSIGNIFTLYKPLDRFRITTCKFNIRHLCTSYALVIYS